MTNPMELPNAPPPAPRRSGGFLQTFGLDVRVALLLVIVDTMAFSATVVSGGLLLPVEIGSAIMLGIITFRIQKAWYGDARESALIKSLIVGLVTAIPVPITALVAGPGGFLGLMHLIFGKRK